MEKLWKCIAYPQLMTVPGTINISSAGPSRVGVCCHPDQGLPLSPLEYYANLQKIGMYKNAYT